MTKDGKISKSKMTKDDVMNSGNPFKIVTIDTGLVHNFNTFLNDQYFLLHT